MKKLFLLLCLVSFVTQLHASLRQTQYRWRNDDGNETTATWRAAINTPTVVTDINATLRLRIEFDNDNQEAESSVVEETLQYSANGGTTWVSITASAATNAFVYQTSTLVTNGAATTNQMGSTTVGVFTAGRIVSAPRLHLPVWTTAGERNMNG